MSYNAITKTPSPALQTVFVATSAQELEIMMTACAAILIAVARTVCEAFHVKLPSITQRDSGRTKQNAGHLPSNAYCSQRTRKVLFARRQPQNLGWG